MDINYNQQKYTYLIINTNSNREYMERFEEAEWLILTVMALYTDDCTVIITHGGPSESLEVKAARNSTESTVVFCCLQ